MPLRGPIRGYRDTGYLSEKLQRYGMFGGKINQTLTGYLKKRFRDTEHQTSHFLKQNKIILFSQYLPISVSPENAFKKNPPPPPQGHNDIFRSNWHYRDTNHRNYQDTRYLGQKLMGYTPPSPSYQVGPTSEDNTRIWHFQNYHSTSL